MCMHKLAALFNGQPSAAGRRAGELRRRQMHEMAVDHRALLRAGFRVVSWREMRAAK